MQTRSHRGSVRYPIVMVFACVCLMLGGLSGCGGGQDTGERSVFVAGMEDELYAEGLRARRAGDLDGAERALRGATEANPRYIAAWLALGAVLEDRGDLSGARDAYGQGVAIQERNVDAQLGLARAEAGLRNVDAANAAAARAVELAQANRLSDIEAEALRIRAEMQLVTGDIPGALTSLERTLELDSTNVQARVRLAELYEQVGRRNDAVRLLSLAASTLRDAEGLLHVGRTFHAFGMHDRAAEILQRAYEGAPEHDGVGYFLAASNLELGNRTLAVSLASRIIARNPAYLDAWVLRARAELQRIPQERDAATRREIYRRVLPDLEQVIARAPEHYEAFVVRGQVEHGLGNTEAALATWRHAMQLHPERVDALRESILAEHSRENAAGVVALVDPDPGRIAGDADLREKYGRALVQAGRPGDGARVLAEVATERRIDHALHHFVARTILDHPGDLTPADALHHANEALAHGGNMRIAYRVVLIDALHASGRTTEALSHARDSLEDFPDNPQLLDRIRDMQ